jgi:glucokinase
MNDPQTLVQDRLAHNSWGFLGTQGYVAGIDIGSYGLRAVLVDLQHHTYASLQREISSSNPDALVDDAIELVNILLRNQNASARHVVRVGVGFGGPVDARGGVTRLSHRMPGWENWPLRARIEEGLGAVTLIDNDANLIALAEATFGVGKDIQNLFYMHLSSGVGGGLVLNGHLYQGATTTAGEIGHALLTPPSKANPEAIPPDLPPTLEQRLSIRGLIHRASQLGFETNLLSDIFSEHPIGKQVVNESVDLLAICLSQVAALIDPQMIVLGGVVARHGGEPFLAMLRERFHEYRAPFMSNSIEILGSVLGFESVAIGGVALALESISD